MTRQAWCLAVLTLFVMAAGRPASAIDAFTNDETADWSHEGASPNPPTIIAGGGPGGEGDAYLENISSGVGFEGSTMMMFNEVQWTGDYLAERVACVTADMRNYGETNLLMRIALGKGTNPNAATWYASTEPYLLAANSSEWHMSVPFELSEDALTFVNGSGTLQEVLADVGMVRILSSTALSFRGDKIAASLGIDNITAVPEDLLGDMNGDWLVDEQDIDLFVDQLISGLYQTEADMNEDGRVNGLDVAAFVAAVTEGGATAQPVPEPSTPLLFALGLFILGAKRRRSGI